jgi:hypothetical protein
MDHQKMNDNNDLINDYHRLMIICKQEKMLMKFVEEKSVKTLVVEKNSMELKSPLDYSEELC